MPIQIIWGNDLNACNKFIQQIVKEKVSKTWGEINVSYLNGDDAVSYTHLTLPTIYSV